MIKKMIYQHNMMQVAAEVQGHGDNTTAATFLQAFLI